MEELQSYLIPVALAVLVAAVFVVRKYRRRRRKELREDILKNLYGARLEEKAVTGFEIGGRLGLSPAAMQSLVEELEAGGLLRSSAGSLELTGEGERQGRQVLRAHRFWERYLADEARAPLESLHDRADRAEHRLGREAVQALSDHLGHPRRDPHGDVIPRAFGEAAHQTRSPLTDWPCDQPACVIHVEDEPAESLREALQAGLRPGRLFRVVAKGAGEMTIDAGEGPRSIAAAVAAKIDVSTPPAGQAPHAPRATLADLGIDGSAKVLGLKEGCHGLMRRRLLDLGFTDGASITAVLSNAGKGARAYRIRGTMIALRREQAEQVLIGRMSYAVPDGPPQGEAPS